MKSFRKTGIFTINRGVRYSHTISGDQTSKRHTDTLECPSLLLRNLASKKDFQQLKQIKLNNLTSG